MCHLVLNLSRSFVVLTNGRTNLNAPTIDCKRGTAFQSTGAGRLSRRLRCRTCSTTDRTRRTSCLLCGATSRRGGRGCASQNGRGLSSDQERDSKTTFICRIASFFYGSICSRWRWHPHEGLPYEGL